MAIDAARLAKAGNSPLGDRTKRNMYWRKTSRILPLAMAAGLALFLGDGQSAAQTSAFMITTHHVDVGRTGWNAKEKVLTPASVTTGGFGLLARVSLDEQVDAQPLYVSGGRLRARATTSFTSQRQTIRSTPSIPLLRESCCPGTWGRRYRCRSFPASAPTIRR